MWRLCVSGASTNPKHWVSQIQSDSHQVKFAYLQMSLLILLKAVNLPNISNRTASFYDVLTPSKTYLWYHVPNSWTNWTFDWPIKVYLWLIFPSVSIVNISHKLNFLSFPVARRVLWPRLIFFNCNHRMKTHHLGKFLKFSWVCSLSS